MSVKIMSQVWPLQMPQVDKLVLLALADNANDDGQCWPSIAVLTEKTCLSERAVQQSIKRLTDTGHVMVTRRYKQSNIFSVYPARRSPEQYSPERPSPEQDAPSTPHDVHPLKTEPSKRTVRSKQPTKRPLKTHIPEDFDLTAERKSYAEKHLPNVDAAALMAVFRSTSKAKGWVYVDWDQHWQTLVRQWAPNSGHWSSGQYPKQEGGIRW